ELPRVEQVEEVVEVALDRGAREDDGEAALLEVGDERASALERRDLVDHLVEELLPAVAHLVAEPLLDVLARDGGDELVAAHPHVTVQAPDREHEVVLPEGAIPRERVVVVRVDERAVDVEDRGAGQPAAYDCVSPCSVFSRCSSCLPSANSSIIFALNAGMSSGLRLVTS